MPGSGARGDAGRYFALLRELREFRMARLGGEPSDRALGRAAGVKADTVKAWLTRGQFPQDCQKLVALVAAVAAEAAARGIIPIGSQAAALDAENWWGAYQEEVRRRAGEVSAGALRGQASRLLAGSAAGLPLAEMTDPFALEVHRPVKPDDPQPGLAPLPEYLAREHDTELRQVTAAAARGTSGTAVLVGGSSTGKTRACWEALGPLRDRPERWRLWHPIDPTRPEAALRELPAVGPRTVVWLNEAQFYLITSDETGERIAAGLRELLRDPARGPVLVLATLWPEYWNELASRPPAGEPDQHSQARELLAGYGINVPASLTEAELREAAASGDPRLVWGAAAADSGRVIQFLAGAPELIDRYENAPPAARALLDASLDARRIGMRGPLPRAFLEEAAPGYIVDADWSGLAEDWLDQALGYTVASCKGVPGPLVPVRAYTGLPSGPASYRVADYLEQHGRRTRLRFIPQRGFWEAAARHASYADLRGLARAATGCGLLRDAALIRMHAVARGNTGEAAVLIRDLSIMVPLSGDPRPAQWAVEHASLDNPFDVAWLLGALLDAGAGEQATVLASRGPASHVSLSRPDGVVSLLGTLREAGAGEQVAVLASRAAAHAPIDNWQDVAWLLNALREAGAGEQVAVLASRAAAHAPLDSPHDAAWLLNALREAGAGEQVTILADRAASHTRVDDPGGVASLLGALGKAGAGGPATILAGRAATHTAIDSPHDVAWLLNALREAGAGEQVTILADRAAIHTPVEDLLAIASLLGALGKAGAHQQVSILASRAATYAPLGDSHGVASLLDSLRVAGAHQQASLLVRRDPASRLSFDDLGAVIRLLDALRAAGADREVTTLASSDPAARVSLDNARDVARLLDTLRIAGADQQSARLVARGPASRASLSDPGAIAWLLDTLRRAGADVEVTILSGRAATHAPLYDLAGVASLLDALRKAGARQQITTLTSRDPATHASLGDARSVALLLNALQEAGAHQQVTILADRAATHASLHDPGGVVSLLNAIRKASAGQQVTILASRAATHAPLDQWNAGAQLLAALWEVGAPQQAETLIERLPLDGKFDLFLAQADRQARYKFGREPDGSQARPWGWEELAVLSPPP
jgi:hypothetical protein